MELLKFILLYVIIVTMVAGRREHSEDSVRHVLKQHLKMLMKDTRAGPIMCTRLAKEPYFRADLLLGRAWRIYYTWNTNISNQCLDMMFRNATLSMINRMHKDMSEYLTTEPFWAGASMLVRMGRTKHEMLLFPDPLSPGRFQGVPNLIQDGNSPKLNSVPLLNFHLKLMYGGKYLLMADCQVGVTTLSAHRKSIPFRAEVSNIANNLNFGPGHHACISDKHKDENKRK